MGGEIKMEDIIWTNEPAIRFAALAIHPNGKSGHGDKIIQRDHDVMSLLNGGDRLLRTDDEIILFGFGKTELQDHRLAIGNVVKSGLAAEIFRVEMLEVSFGIINILADTVGELPPEIHEFASVNGFYG